MAGLTRLDLDFFTQQSALSSPGMYTAYFEGLPRDFYTNGHLEDHFITEWWHAEECRWQYTDPQFS